MKKRISKIGLTRWIGIIGLSVLVLALVASLLIQNIQAPVADAELLFIGTTEDADCTVLLSQDCCLMVDTGVSADAPHITEVLKEHGVETIDCLILTHPDQDHIGGASALLKSFSITQVITPYYGQYNSLYNSLLKEIDALEGTERLTLTAVKNLRLGDLRITLYPPEKNFYDGDNDYSIVTLVNHGGVNILLAGDIEKQRITELADVDFPEIQLLKVPYHGRSSNASADFIRRIAPKLAVVNAAEPESKIRKVLSKMDAEIFCTVGQDAFFLSDGETVSPIS